MSLYISIKDVALLLGRSYNTARKEMRKIAEANDLYVVSENGKIRYQTHRITYQVFAEALNLDPEWVESKVKKARNEIRER